MPVHRKNIWGLFPLINSIFWVLNPCRPCGAAFRPLLTGVGASKCAKKERNLTFFHVFLGANLFLDAKFFEMQMVLHTTFFRCKKDFLDAKCYF